MAYTGYGHNTACNSFWYTVSHPSCWNEEGLNVPVIRSTMPDGSSIPVVPTSGESASQTVQAISNQQILDWQADNINSMAELGRNQYGLSLPDNWFDPFGNLNFKGMFTPLLIGVGVILALKLVKGR